MAIKRIKKFGEHNRGEQSEDPDLQNTSQKYKSLIDPEFLMATVPGIQTNHNYVATNQSLIPKFVII
jgi:hypothetical protein